MQQQLFGQSFECMNSSGTGLTVCVHVCEEHDAGNPEARKQLLARFLALVFT